MRASVLCPPLNWNTLPCKAGFEAEIAQLLGEYDAVIEMGRLAVLKDFADLQMQAPIMLFANAFIPASMFENVAVVCCSSKAHMRFYQRMGMKKMCEVLPRPNAAVDLTLMAHRWDHECFLKEVHISTLEAKALMAKIPAALKDQLFPPFVAALQPA